jgi:hypothetical protein
VTKLDKFEVEYRTKGDFKVTVFNTGDGQLSVAVSSGRIGATTAYIKPAELEQLRALIISARSKL